MCVRVAQLGVPRAVCYCGPSVAKPTAFGAHVVVQEGPKCLPPLLVFEHNIKKGIGVCGSRR